MAGAASCGSGFVVTHVPWRWCSRSAGRKSGRARTHSAPVSQVHTEVLAGPRARLVPNSAAREPTGLTLSAMLGDHDPEKLAQMEAKLRPESMRNRTEMADTAERLTECQPRRREPDRSGLLRTYRATRERFRGAAQAGGASASQSSAAAAV